MIGPILLALSWFLLRLERRKLSDLGFSQPRRRAGEFLLGFGVFGLASGVQQLGLSVAASDPFVLNPNVDASVLLNSIRFNINSVLYEELLFRGYLLFLAMRRLGAMRASLLSAAAFGMYHWFSYGVIGNPVAMVYVFILTGALGYVWARAFVVTGSVFAAIGMHLGWNVVAQLVFSAGPLGPALLVPESGRLPIVTPGGAGLALNVLLPLLLVAAVLWYLQPSE